MGEASYYPELEIPVLVLRGTPYEMGYQRGRLFSERIKATADYYLTLPERLLGNTRIGRMKGLSSLVISALNSTYRLPMIKNLVPAVEDELLGVCDGAGLPEEEVMPLLFMPDIILNILGLALKGQETLGRLAGSFPLSGLLGGSRNLGCTSIAAWGAATRDTLEGRLVTGRNMDFLGFEQLAHHPLLVLYEPDKGQRYLAVTAEAIPTAGVTAMNESGITVAVHMNFSLDCSLKGKNMMNVAHEVARKAHTLDEAVKVAVAHHAATGFTLFITSGEERRAAAVEFSARRAAVRYPAQGTETLAQTNHYFDRELKDREVKMLSLELKSGGRMKRCLSLLGEHHGSIGPEEVAAFLGDRFDIIAGRERTMGNMISQPSTTMSMVMVPEERRIYVARNSPHSSLSPASDGQYHGYSLGQIAAGDFSGRPGTLQGSTFSRRKPREHQAHELFMQGMTTFYGGGGSSYALKRVAEACERSGEEPFHHYVRGLLEISHGMECGVEDLVMRGKALASFSEGLRAAGGSPYLESFGRFFLARTHLAADRVEEANVHIRALEELAEEDLTAEELCKKARAVRRSRKRSFVPSEPDGLILEYVGII